MASAALLLYALTAGAHSFALRSRSASLQASALAASETALKQCAGSAGNAGGGLAKCDGKVVFVNELEYSAAQQTSFEAAAGAHVYLGEPPAAAPKSAGVERACVTRIVLVDGAQRAAHFCAVESEGENNGNGKSEGKGEGKGDDK